MSLSDEAIYEFQQIYSEVMGKKLNFKEAKVIALNWMKFVYFILKK